MLVPLGKGNRLVQGYCVRVATQPRGLRPLKSVAEVVDRQSLLSPAMLRLTRWIAGYYLCSWGQVLETVLPAGVRGQAGTRMATLLTLDPQGTELLAAGSLPDKQAANFVPAAASEPLTLQELARGPLLAGADCHAAPQGADPRRPARVSSLRQVEAVVPCSSD